MPPGPCAAQEEGPLENGWGEKRGPLPTLAAPFHPPSGQQAALFPRWPCCSCIPGIARGDSLPLPPVRAGTELHGGGEWDTRCLGQTHPDLHDLHVCPLGLGLLLWVFEFTRARPPPTTLNKCTQEQFLDISSPSSMQSGFSWVTLSESLALSEH